MALNGNGSGSGPDQAQSKDLVVQPLPKNWGLEDDDPMLPLLQANAQLEAKVEQWSTAILELAALARNQNQVMQETSQNSLRLTSALSSFEQESVQLRALIKQLGGSLTELKGAPGRGQEGLNQSALQALVPILSGIKAELTELEQANRQNRKLVQAGNVRGEWLSYAIGALLGVLAAMMLGGYWFYGQVTAHQAYLSQQSSWMLTKLERVEKALGVQPNK